MRNAVTNAVTNTVTNGHVTGAPNPKPNPIFFLSKTSHHVVRYVTREAVNG